MTAAAKKLLRWVVVPDGTLLDIRMSVARELVDAGLLTLRREGVGALHIVATPAGVAAAKSLEVAS